MFGPDLFFPRWVILCVCWTELYSCFACDKSHFRNLSAQWENRIPWFGRGSEMTVLFVPLGRRTTNCVCQKTSCGKGCISQIFSHSQKKSWRQCYPGWRSRHKNLLQSARVFISGEVTYCTMGATILDRVDSHVDQLPGQGVWDMSMGVAGDPPPRTPSMMMMMMTMTQMAQRLRQAALLATKAKKSFDLACTLREHCIHQQLQRYSASRAKRKSQNQNFCHVRSQGVFYWPADCPSSSRLVCATESNARIMVQEWRNKRGFRSAHLAMGLPKSEQPRPDEAKTCGNHPKGLARVWVWCEFHPSVVCAILQMFHCVHSESRIVCLVLIQMTWKMTWMQQDVAQVRIQVFRGEAIEARSSDLTLDLTPILLQNPGLTCAMFGLDQRLPRLLHPTGNKWFGFSHISCWQMKRTICMESTKNESDFLKTKTQAKLTRHGLKHGPQPKHNI